jgi:hypothetical protein
MKMAWAVRNVGYMERTTICHGSPVTPVHGYFAARDMLVGIGPTWRGRRLSGILEWGPPTVDPDCGRQKAHPALTKSDIDGEV